MQSINCVGGGTANITSTGPRTVLMWNAEYNTYGNGSNINLTYKYDQDGTWKKYYNIHDHLGNVRSVVRDDGKIVKQFDYAPFGAVLNSTDINRTKFIGKEKDKESNYADHGVRKYDDEIGRFTSIDPLWEKYYSLTPYKYAGNNPVSFLDGNGKWLEYYHELLIRAACSNRGLSEEQVNQIVEGCLNVDKKQGEDEQYLHAMVSEENVKEEGYEAAVNKADEKRAEEDRKNIELFQKDMDWNALGALLHTIQDSNSPSHKGNQIWYKGGVANPKNWSHPLGDDGTINPKAYQQALDGTNKMLDALGLPKQKVQEKPQISVPMLYRK